MEVHNNFSPLAFRKKESKATYEKWYAFGKNYAIPASANTLTPFQFTELNIPVFDPNTIEVEVINEETGEAKKSGVYVSFDVMPEHGGVLYVSPGKNSFREALPQGTYRARFSIGDEVYISTPFCVIPGIETSSKYLLIEYWNDEKIAYPGGFITTGANNDFKYQMYVPATICKPKYEFEEELTKRAGYKFLELQTSTKVYAFTFVAPEFICDAMRLIRLSDYIRISHDGEYYNALNFEFDVDWQEQLYLAAVDCQFETDSIIQKLPSFNRRDKASFYNALLANIDTPIMFSPDTVGLYYKEYRETEPVVKGKLIRELSPIDLIDENTTIAVDLGTGEARKFNLYRMLQDYISKAHEDATDFLLHLRGGATFGEGITGSAASINAVGDAEVQGLNARVTKVKSLDSEDYVTVNKTAFTVNKQGDTALNALNARGDSHLQQDVYTGNNTGKITKEGQLQYLSAVIQEFITSPTFVPGFLGEGFKIWVENGNWHIECDNLTVRQTMNIFELLIQKIRSVNGALVVSQSNGKLSEVKEVGEQYKLTTGEEFPTFQEGDLVRCQTFAGYQGAGLTFDFTQFAKYDYSGGAFDSSLIDVTPDSISFNLNDTGNSGFAFYKFSESSPTPIEIPSFTLTLEGGYPGMMAFAAGLDSNSSPVEGVGVLLQNGDNVIPAIKSEQGIHNFAITITGDSGHGDGKVTVKQKKAAGSAPNNSLVKFYWVEVKAVDGTSFFVDKAEFNGVVPAVGDEVVQMGNTKNPERQALIYITAQESGHPYIEILNGVKTKSLSGTNRTRLGDLSNIQDSAFPEGQQPSGSGLYCDNAFLRGIFLLRNGKSVEDEVNQAKQDAANAATEAERAQQTAQEAKDRLNKWADDGFISPTEKPALIDEGKRIQAEFLQIKNNADKYAVSVTEYTKAYEDYLNELRYHSAQQPEDIAVRPELAKTQTIYYDRRNEALNAIANAAKSYVDEADKKLKEYLDTEITAIPGKIELAVRSLKTANYNLLLDSNHTLSANPYQLGSYKYDVHLVKGKSYTLTVCYKCADSDDVVAYNNPSFGYLAILPKSAEETIVSTKITPSNDDAEYFYFYKTPQKETTQTYIKWAVITEGDIGVATWIPSRTETSVGLKNLCSFKRIIDSGFTYASDYKDDGHFYVSPDKLYEQTKLANKDMFGLTYDPQKQYYIFVDSAIRTDGKLQEYSTFFIIKYTDGTEQRICVVFPDRIEYNHIITNKPISRIVGGYGWYHGSNLRVGVYETNFPVSWSPAPEDQLYQSVKYTDTQILAVDGKIELSVATQLNKRVIGGANLILKSGTCVAGVNRIVRFDMSKYFRDLRGKKVTISFDYEYSNLELGGNNRIGLEEPVLKDGTSEYYWIGTFKYFSSISPKAESGRFVGTITIPNDIVNSQNKGIGLIIQVGNSTNMKVCNPQIEIGDTATGWKPAPEDGVNSSIEYTKSQIDIVEKKIELKVSSTEYEEGISNAQRIARYLSTGRMLPEYSDVCFSKGLNNLKVYNNAGTEGVKIHRSSIAGVPNNTGYSCTINTTLSRGDTTPGAGGFYFGNQARYGAMFLYKLVAAIPKGRILGFSSNAIGDGGALEWLTSNVGTGKWEEYYHLIKCGTSGNLSSSGFFYITDKANVEWHLAYATVYDVFGDNSQINKTTYETKITQLESSISLKASQTDLNSATERIRQAEIKLDSTSIKLGVVEGTANDAKSTASSASSAASSAQSTANAANSLAGTANGKAEAADGRVTATQNGLVETGINITSRKIVLKSDNVLFQNNAGQQTAAINANGKLTANAIEVGEVVAGGFAAQRITTGNLTVTDGAVIGGMTITGGVLTGKAINIQDGAKIGNFTIESGILSANGMVAGMQMRLSNNLMEISSSGLRIDHNSGGYAVNVTGNGRCYMQGVESYRKFGVYEFAGATQWKAPGVHFACTISSAAAVRQKWGNPSIGVSAVKQSTGRYTVRFTGVHSQGFIPMVMALNATKWVNACVEDIVSTTQFTVKLMDVNTGMVDSDFAVYICGFV